MRLQEGITLMELVIVAGLLALLAAVAIPNVTGFLSRGKSSAFDTDRELLQMAVDVWQSTIAKTSGRPYPILLGGQECLGKLELSTGLPKQDGCNPYLDIGALADEGLLRNRSTIKSVDTSKNTTATNMDGSYGWFINTDGLVTSYPTFNEGQYP